MEVNSDGPDQRSSDNEQDWQPFDKGLTIGQKGAEGGTILSDMENVNGARITLEQDCYHNMPFAITYGIYGLLFHTHFKTQLDQAEQYIVWVKSTMNKVFQ